MIIEASYSDTLRPALAYVSNLPERISGWPERWMFHRSDGSFALFHVNWGVRSTAHFQPSLTRIQEPTGPQVVTSLTSPREQRKQVSGVVAPMNAPHYFETKK